MKIFFLIFILSVFNISIAQVITKEPDRAPIDTLLISNDSEIVTESLDFTGTVLTSKGEDFRRSFVNRYEYPIEAMENGISGMISIEFIIEKNGDASEIKVNKSLCESCDAEAIRVIKTTKFKPCEVNGIASRCRFIFPIKLTIAE